MAVEISVSGDFRKTEKFLNAMQRGEMFKPLRSLAQTGVEALASATPMDSGVTASAWGYEIEVTRGAAKITWINTNVVNGFSVAVGLQYGHGTGTGGWVSGQDYINPAIRPIFDKIAEDVWKVVTSA